MTNISENFDFKKYDVGGQDAIAKDGKLTGEEARNARADGYTVWDGYTEQDGEPVKIENPVASKLRELLKNKQNLRTHLDNIKLDNIQNINLEKLFGPKVDGNNIYDVIDELTGKNDAKLTPEQKEARAELDKKEASTGMTYAQAKAKVAEILDKYRDCYDEVRINKYEKSNNVKVGILIDRTEKVFNPNKLPEPARTEYKEARAVMIEIENNNSALCKKGDVDITEMPSNPSTINQEILPTTTMPDGLGFGQLNLTSAEPTEAQKEARTQLDAKVSSTGLTYKDAKAIIKDLTEKYKNNPNCQSLITPCAGEDINGNVLYIRGFAQAFDPYKLPKDDYEKYFKAMNAVQEIETTNYALLVKAGLKRTHVPEATRMVELHNKMANNDIGIYMNDEKIRPELL